MVISSSMKTHSQALCPPIFQPVSSPWTTALPRMERINCWQVGVNEGASRVSNRTNVARLRQKAKTDWKKVWILPLEIPSRCFITQPNASAWGPICTAALPQSIGSLIGVTALHPFNTVLARAYLDLETGGDRLDRRQVGLMLGDDFDLGETPTAAGTHLGG